MWNKFLITVGIFALPALTMAVAEIYNPITSGVTTIGGLFEVILKGITYIAIPVIVLALIWVGFKFVAAQGEPAKILEARSSLMVVLAGAAIILGSNVILDVVTDTARELITEKKTITK